MRHSSFVLALSLVLGSVACTVNVPPSADEPSTPEPEPTVAPIVPAALPFRPSNIDLSGIDVSKLGDVEIKGSCDMLREDPAKDPFCSSDAGAFAFKVVDQPGAGKIAVFFARNIRIEPNATIKIHGTRAVAFVALDTFDVRGTIDASVMWDDPSPGGFEGPQGSIDFANGKGPGAGNAGKIGAGASGGGYCGTGGKGASNPDIATIAGGATAGNPEISPLLGGSTGGKGHLSAGSGGGAIQLVAGKSLVVAASATLSANGGGGWNGGAVEEQSASGGGSGGAILLESLSVTVAGKITANGGAGGGVKERGQDGQPGDLPAESPYSSDGAAGGSGSAGETVHGGDAISGNETTRGWTGGGGAAGRIRINADKIDTSAATLSPRVGPCATQGSLRK